MGRLYKCVVPECNNTTDNCTIYPFFSIPKRKELFNIWISNIKRFDMNSLPATTINHMKICGKHFDFQSFKTTERKRLNRHAVPTLYVPGDNMNIVTEQLLPVQSSLITAVNIDKNVPKSPLSLCGDSEMELPANEDLIESSIPLAQRGFPICTSKKRKSILRNFGESRVENLTPRKKKLYTEVVKYKHFISKLKRHGDQCARNLFNNSEVKDDIFYHPILKNMEKIDKLPTLAKLLINRQLNSFAVSSHDRRFTKDEKAFYCAVLKHSPRGYHYMSKMFHMPTPHALNKYLSNIKLEPGINTQLFVSLKMISARRDQLDRNCVLMFDEVPLAAELSYNQNNDRIDGLETTRGCNLSDHALVFMLRGLRKKWKQPLAFYFIQATAKTHTLKACIKQVIDAVHQQTNFKILASVCNQGSANRAAIQSLCKDYNREEDLLYNINGHEIIHLYDVPHLIKCLRDNFMTKDILFEGNKIAKWAHLVELYILDRGEHQATKLTKDHIYPEGRRKMKVSLAVQAFSRNTHAVMHVLSNAGGMQAANTAEFILLINNLFDSLNGKFNSPSPLGSILKTNSKHFAFWAEANKTICSWEFYQASKQVNNPPCVSSLLKTIRNVQVLWNRTKNLGFKYLLTKSLNQDPLENLFSIIRGLCGQNTAPTCSQFVSALKTAIINNTLKNSEDSNCEDDGSFYLLKINSLFSSPETCPTNDTSP